ncbi:MAG TPA: carbohydrate ABC transporter permease [Victivallales bacterium]|nr:carbohydrate ABC transporter permease [Victivallales bacterium]
MELSKKNKLIIHLLLIFSVILTVFPYIWMVLTSLKTQAQSIQVPPVIIPSAPQWSNYTRLFTILPFANFYLNTAVSTVIITFGQLFLCSMAAYAFARLKFWGRDVLFVLLLSLMMIPSQIYLIPQFLIIQKIGLLNTISALILPSLYSAYGTFLLRQFFMGIPKDLEEAALIDGCNFFQIYYKIMLPLVVPGLIALGILVSLWSWNSLMWPLIVNTSTDKMTLSAGLANLSGRSGIQYPILMAGSVLSSLPIITLFFIFQKKFISGIAITGSKG